MGPWAYWLSMKKCRFVRRVQDMFSGVRFSRHRRCEPLPVVVYAHKSLIRRTLGTVDQKLQENKAVNLSLAAPRVNGVLIRPGETFSFWRMVGPCTARRGYLPGLTISKGETACGVGGGMCQFTNLLHWMVLHTPLVITNTTIMTDMIFFRISGGRSHSERGPRSCTTISITVFITLRNKRSRSWFIQMRFICAASFARNMRSRTNTMCMRRMNIFPVKEKAFTATTEYAAPAST